MFSLSLLKCNNIEDSIENNILEIIWFNIKIKILFIQKLLYYTFLGLLMQFWMHYFSKK